MHCLKRLLLQSLQNRRNVSVYFPGKKIMVNLRQMNQDHFKERMKFGNTIWETDFDKTKI